MSRVDEARRRAGGRDGANREHVFDRAVGVSADDYMLEDYPRERGANPERVPAARVARPIAAPRSGATRHLGSLDPALEGKLVGSAQTPPFVIEQYRRLGAS